MSYEEEFDRLMREKAEGLDFPFDESHWEKASKLIAKNRGMGRSTMLKVAAAIVAVGGMATAVILYSPEVTRTATHEVAATKTNESSSETVQPIQENKITEPVKEKNSGSFVSMSENSNASAGEVKFSMKKRQAVPAEKASSGQVDQAERVTAASSPEQPVIPVENANVSNAPNAPVSAGAAATGSDKEKESPVNITPEAEQISIGANEHAEVLDRKTAFLESGNQQKEIVAKRLVVFKSPDYYKKSSTPIKFYLDAYAGGAYQNGWENGSANDGAGFSWYGGVSAGYFLTKNLSISSGLQAYNIGNIKQPFYTVYSTNYDFSSVTTRTVISCSDLLYLAVPLHLGYHFDNNKKSLRVGVYASQLIRASTSVESSTILDNEAIDKTTKETNAVYEGMTQQIFMASAGYNMKVGKRVHVNAELVYALNPIFSPAAYGGVTAKPAALRLGIAYRMLER